MIARFFNGYSLWLALPRGPMEDDHEVLGGRSLHRTYPVEATPLSKPADRQSPPPSRLLLPVPTSVERSGSSRTTATSSIPIPIPPNPIPTSLQIMSGGMNLSKEFFELIKAIGESKSKQEEDRIILKEVQKLKHKMETPITQQGASNPLVNSKKLAKEFLVRLLYVEMLGHDASFGYIKAVEMAASASLYHKRTGYLICGACLAPHHEFRFMLVNQMQRDLQSANVLECCGGLLATTNIITSDMVPAVSSEVTKLLGHESATVRKKAIVALHKFHQLAPEVVTAQELQDLLRKILCDKDPSVMGSSLNVIHAMARIDPMPFKDLVPSLVSILKQIGDHRLPTDYDYHRVPAPWMQIQLIRILGLLGRGDAQASSGMYEMVHEAMKKADTGINAGYAIAYECIKTIVTIYPNPTLLDSAADAISRFIQSRSHNLKYLAITGLALIVEGHPQYAAQHQLAVLDCLEDPDETLQRKTLDLLYRMTNPVNVEFIADKLLDFLSHATDPFLKRVLTQRVCEIAERYAPNNAWYVKTVTKLFEVSGDMVPPDVAQNLMSLIAEGTGESEEADMLLRQNAVELYVVLLRDKPVGSLPRILLETMAWCLGEYGYLSAVCGLDDLLLQLCTLTRTHKAKLAPSTRRFLVLAIMKLVAQSGTCPPHAAAVIDDFTKSRDVDLQQRCGEFQTLLTNCPSLLPLILPVDASAEDLDVDESLSFLDNYVQAAVHNGARQYQKPEDDDDDDYGGANGVAEPTTAFKMTPYEKPQAPAHAMLAMSGIGSGGGRSSQAGMSLPPGAHGTTGSSLPAPGQQQLQGGGLNLNTRNVTNKWGRGGINTATAPPPPTSSTTPPRSPAASGTASQPAPSSSSSWQPAPSAASAYATPAAPPPPVKTAEQLEKERMAAALFGGIVPGAPPPPPPQPAPLQTPMSFRQAAPSAPAPPPPSAPAPAPEVDLLDMGLWDASPAPTPASTPSLDVLAPSALDSSTGPAASQAGPIVETVTDDDEDAPPAAAPSAAATPASVDPFADAGLLGDVLEKPLASFSLSSSSKFEYNGTPMAPLPITTPQFGQQWGTCPAASTISVQSSKIRTLEQFMTLCADVGAHKVEAIAVSNEGISAGMLGGGSQIVLIHGKITPLGSTSNIDATVKSTDQKLCGSLALYLQTLAR